MDRWHARRVENVRLRLIYLVKQGWKEARQIAQNILSEYKC